jgi:hypothetical protein
MQELASEAANCGLSRRFSFTPSGESRQRSGRRHRQSQSRRASVESECNARERYSPLRLKELDRDQAPQIFHLLEQTAVHRFSFLLWSEEIITIKPICTCVVPIIGIPVRCCPPIFALPSHLHYWPTEVRLKSGQVSPKQSVVVHGRTVGTETYLLQTSKMLTRSRVYRPRPI